MSNDECAHMHLEGFLLQVLVWEMEGLLQYSTQLSSRQRFVCLIQDIFW